MHWWQRWAAHVQIAGVLSINNTAILRAVLFILGPWLVIRRATCRSQALDSLVIVASSLVQETPMFADSSKADIEAAVEVLSQLFCWNADRP